MDRTAAAGQRIAPQWSGVEGVPPLLASAPEPGDHSLFEHLLAAVETHVAEEADAVAAYRRLSETSPDPVVALLIRLVVEDEDRHHALMARIAGGLRDGLYWTHSAESLPKSPRPLPAVAAETLTGVQDFARQEHEGVREMQALAHDMQRVHDGLDSLLLETMALDSQKHERILRFIAKRLGSAAKASG
jgi:hypothetical protein